MASIKETSIGTYRARVSYVNELTGKREYKSETFSGIRAAKSWAREMEQRKESRNGFANESITLPEYFKTWYETFKLPLISERTQMRYEYAINLLEKCFPTQPMASLTRTDYQRFLNAYGKNHAIASSKKVNTQIKAAVHSAVEDGVIDHDFTAKTSPSGHAPKSADLKFLSLKDMTQLTKQVMMDINPEHPTKMMILVALMTGARYGEIAGMTWEDIDFKKNMVSIDKTWDYIKNTGFKPTKNPQSIRKLPVDLSLIQTLKKYHQLQREMQIRLGVKNKENLLFITPEGKVPSSTSANKTLKVALHQIEAEKVITFHGLRHTHASYLIYQGISIYVISKRLGHTNYNITLEVYSHVIQEMQEQEDQKILVAIGKLYA